MEKLDLKIAFVDIDWTIYDHSSHKYDKKSIKALKQLQKEGVKVILCTARPYYSIREFGVLDHINPDGVIFSSGAGTIYENKVVDFYEMDKDTLIKVVDVCKKYNQCLELVTMYDRFYATPFNNIVEKHYGDYFENKAIEEEYKDQIINTACLFSPKEMDKTLKKEFPKNIIYNRFGNFGVDILIKAHEKGDAVTNLLNYLNISKDNAVAFGDDYADISMLKAVKYGVQVGDKIEKLTKVAYYTTSSVTDHGVYRFLKKHKLVKFIL